MRALRRASYLVRPLVENAGDDSGHVDPFGGLGLELTRTGSGERVKAGAAIVLRLTPLAFDPVPALKTIDGGVEGPLQDFEALAGDLLDAQQDAVAMQRTERDRLEDEHLECALREFNRFRQRLSPIWERRVRALSFPVKETANRGLSSSAGSADFWRMTDNPEVD